MENNFASIEHKLIPNSATAEAEQSERGLANTKMMEDLRDLREKKNEAKEKPKLAYLWAKLAISNTRGRSQSAVVQSTWSFPGHFHSKRSWNVGSVRDSSQVSRKSDEKPPSSSGFHCGLTR